jgi:hypothetical protein
MILQQNGTSDRAFGHRKGPTDTSSVITHTAFRTPTPPFFPAKPGTLSCQDRQPFSPKPMLERSPFFDGQKEEENDYLQSVTCQTA